MAQPEPLLRPRPFLPATGEYVAVESVEAALGRCPLVEQVRPGAARPARARHAVGGAPAPLLEQRSANALGLKEPRLAHHALSPLPLPTSPQIWVYGNSFEPSLVAVVVPLRERLEAWGRAAGLLPAVKVVVDSGDGAAGGAPDVAADEAYRGLCGMAEARAHVLEGLVAAGEGGAGGAARVGGGGLRAARRLRNGRSVSLLSTLPLMCAPSPPGRAAKLKGFELAKVRRRCCGPLPRAAGGQPAAIGCATFSRATRQQRPPPLRLALTATPSPRPPICPTPPPPHPPPPHQAVYLEPELFSVDNNLMTPKFSLKRPQLLARYKKQVRRRRGRARAVAAFPCACAAAARARRSPPPPCFPLPPPQIDAMYDALRTVAN
jgi:hypothetical protein